MSDIVKLHFCYVTEIIYNGKIYYYFGKHSTSNINDKYHGSSKFINDLKESKKNIKYELSTTPLCFFDSSDLAFEFEELLIDCAKDKYNNCVNFKPGGAGGFYKNPQICAKLASKMVEKWKDPLYKKRTIQSMTEKWKSKEHRSKMIKSAKSYNALSSTRERKSKQAKEKFIIENYSKIAKNPMYKNFYELHELWKKYNKPSYASFHKICLSLNMEYSINNCRPIVDRFRRLECQNM